VSDRGSNAVGLGLIPPLVAEHADPVPTTASSRVHSSSTSDRPPNHAALSHSREALAVARTAPVGADPNPRSSSRIPCACSSTSERAGTDTGTRRPAAPHRLVIAESFEALAPSRVVVLEAIRLRPVFACAKRSVIKQTPRERDLPYGELRRHDFGDGSGVRHVF
jgi:hypothetical protein